MAAEEIGMVVGMIGMEVGMTDLGEVAAVTVMDLIVVEIAIVDVAEIVEVVVDQGVIVIIVIVLVRMNARVAAAIAVDEVVTFVSGGQLWWSCLCQKLYGGVLLAW
ncbi:hypothetical protein KFK09_025036 [Dendrobium nobile]|uniref:Uncharacterized protein n=1 Tax=Dendrobium nobile TaxID=94219 RepID=A0A8T3AFF0_DENNO|nr:hypothetical protein KFK09_025036 [Dendrobium nobile]